LFGHRHCSVSSRVYPNDAVMKENWSGALTSRIQGNGGARFPPTIWLA
jgi:hypothetical protein